MFKNVRVNWSVFFEAGLHTWCMKCAHFTVGNLIFSWIKHSLARKIGSALSKICATLINNLCVVLFYNYFVHWIIQILAIESLEMHFFLEWWLVYMYSTRALNIIHKDSPHVFRIIEWHSRVERNTTYEHGNITTWCSLVMCYLQSQSPDILHRKTLTLFIVVLSIFLRIN